MTAADPSPPERITYLTDDPNGNVFVGYGDPLNETSPAKHAFASVSTTPAEHRAVLDYLNVYVEQHGSLTVGNGAQALGAAHAALRQTVEDPR